MIFTLLALPLSGLIRISILLMCAIVECLYSPLKFNSMMTGTVVTLPHIYIVAVQSKLVFTCRVKNTVLGPWNVGSSPIFASIR